MASLPPSLLAAVTTVAAITAAAVVAWHGTIDGQTFAAIVSGALGLGAGAGIHAAGVNQSSQSKANGGS